MLYKNGIKYFTIREKIAFYSYKLKYAKTQESKNNAIVNLKRVSSEIGCFKENTIQLIDSSKIDNDTVSNKSRRVILIDKKNMVGNAVPIRRNNNYVFLEKVDNGDRYVSKTNLKTISLYDIYTDNRLKDKNDYLTHNDINKLNKKMK